MKIWRDTDINKLSELTMNPDTPSLLPCRCGGALLVGEIRYDTHTKWQISCCACHRSTKQLDTERQAREAWNYGTAEELASRPAELASGVVVPVEPTEEMLNAGTLMPDEMRGTGNYRAQMHRAACVYKAMLSARPQLKLEGTDQNACSTTDVSGDHKQSGEPRPSSARPEHVCTSYKDAWICIDCGKERT